MYRARSALRHGQMSEAFSTMVFLTLSGGLQDTYTYCVRGQVFANAQTGNIVLMSQRAFAGDLAGVLRYLIPLLAFALGVFAAEMVRRRCQEISRLHWRQMVVLAEIGLLLGVGFLPSSWDAPANALVSFTCASTCADVQCGDIVVVSGSVRMDGTSLHYLPMEFPAVPSYQLLKALEESSVSLGFHTTVGVSITKDSFYTQAEPETKPVSDDLIRRWQSYVRGGAVCTSMEESILFSVGSSLGIRTASILVSATNFDGSVSKRNSADVYPTDSIQKPILSAIEALRRIIRQDKG